MNKKLSAVAAFLIDIERLKLVERWALVSDFSRRENSAEHSWHLALGLLILARELDLAIDLPRALTMAIVASAVFRSSDLLTLARAIQLSRLSDSIAVVVPRREDLLS